MDSYNTPSTDDQRPSPPGNDVTTTLPSAPSDWLPHLPSSSSKVFPPEQNNSPTVLSTENPPKDPSKPQVDAQGRTLNPRSCVTCRKRKVKCDKIHPCSNCNRAHIECVFPAPGRAPRRVVKIKDGRDKELLERLRRLEGVVKGLGVDVPEQYAETPDHVDNAGKPVEIIHDEVPNERHAGMSPSANGTQKDLVHHYVAGNHSDRTNRLQDRQQGQLENRFGRLVVNEGKSRYINNSFWANLSNEVEDLKGILNESSEDEDIDESPNSNANTKIGGAQQGWVFGFSSQNVDLLSLHPLPSQIRTYWEVYKDRVDPLVKVLHLPSMESTVLSSASHLSNLSKGFEVLLFTIYYAATTSMLGTDCAATFGEEKSVLLARYRFGVEQALARANFLVTEETVVLQAFVIFLICLRRNNDARVIWTLTGLVVRIAQTLGVHRDGSHFGLPPFEIEMRRRLWWQVCILDARAGEDHGCDPTITEQSFDTKMPLNINDVDISPEMTEFPPERQGCTDISFCLIRFEVANTFRRINYIPPGSRACGDYHTNLTLQDKERWITDCHNRLEDRYLKHCDMSVPLFWVTATVARLIMSKMWLMVYHPFQRHDGGASLPGETKEKLFITSLENLEYSILLETESRTMKWGWLFKTYMQWHALAFILWELCHRTKGELVERAWKAVEKSKDGRWGVRFTEDARADHLWRPLKKIYQKAKDARAVGVQEEALTKPQMPLQPLRTYSPNANPMFGHPSRPGMTRAPLSRAQLQRFVSGPSFGKMPVDKHELFRSPKLSETIGQEDIDPMDSLSLQNGTSQLHPSHFSMSNGSVVPTNAGYPAFDALAMSGMQQPNPQYGPNFFHNFANNQIYPLNRAANGVGRMDSLDTDEVELGDLDMSVMDTAGDLDWENWDQLVKQFGMDIDSGPTDWAGGGWDAMVSGSGFRGTQGGSI